MLNESDGIPRIRVAGGLNVEESTPGTFSSAILFSELLTPEHELKRKIINITLIMRDKDVIMLILFKIIYYEEII
jgi:hypothetical protein